MAFILITLFNVLSMFTIRDRVYTAIALVFQWVLLMQLFEALAWRDQACGPLNQAATKLAFLANVAQPIVAFLLLMHVSKAPNTHKIAASIVLLIYVLWLVFRSTELRESDLDCLNPGDGGCANLQYKWWSKLTPPYVYHVSLIAIVLLLLQPLKLSALIVGIIIATFVLSAIFYGCGVASTWCFFAAFVPILNALAFKHVGL
jgi:hypothetical protein